MAVHLADQLDDSRAAAMAKQRVVMMVVSMAAHWAGRSVDYSVDRLEKRRVDQWVRPRVDQLGALKDEMKADLMVQTPERRRADPMAPRRVDPMAPPTAEKRAVPWVATTVPMRADLSAQ